MGIFPYWTPVEYNRMKRKTQHFDDFCKLKGYAKLFDNGYGGATYKDEAGFLRHDSSAPWLAKNGKTYTDRELFRKETGWYPYLIKEGVVYGWSEPRSLDGYKDPWEEEVRFLEAWGYRRGKPDFFPKDYIESIEVEGAFYEKNGWLPRWQDPLDGDWWGHHELLVSLGYQYPGEPPFPVLIDSDFVRPKGWH
jgi:hypothetical protein